MPECADPDFNLAIVPPSLNSVVGALLERYGNYACLFRRLEVLASFSLMQIIACSDCFLKCFHRRLESPFMPDGDHTDYLHDQWTDIQAKCGKNMPATAASKRYMLVRRSQSWSTTISPSLAYRLSCSLVPAGRGRRISSDSSEKLC